MDPVTQLRICLWGEIKTAKSTFALTFPKPLVVFDLDQSFDRAMPRYMAQNPATRLRRLYQQNGQMTDANLVGADIIAKTYHPPVKWGKRPLGFVDFWNHLVQDIILTYETDHIKSLAFDTGTVLWSVRTDAHLERAQSSNPGRINLIQIEYAEPNADMRACYGGARAYGKNLVSIHHVGGKYESKLTDKGQEKKMRIAQGLLPADGQTELNSRDYEDVRIGDTWAGFNGVGRIVDLIARSGKVQLSTSNIQPTLEILDCGWTLTAEGITVPNPTFENVLVLINTLREADNGQITAT